MAVRTITSLLLLLAFGTVTADAVKGEFLGYQLGARLNNVEPGDLRSDRNIYVKGRDLLFDINNMMFNPFYISVVPVNDNFDEVLLLVTPISYTVFQIRGIIYAEGAGSVVWAKGEAVRTQSFFYDILTTKYPDWEASCFTPEDMGDQHRTCSLKNKNYTLNLEIEMDSQIKDHYVETHISMESNDLALHTLNREERYKWAKVRDAQVYEETDKTGL